MRTLDEEFEKMLAAEQRPVDDHYRDGPHYKQRRSDFLAGASVGEARERERVLKVVTEIATDGSWNYVSGDRACAEIERRITEATTEPGD